MKNIKPLGNRILIERKEAVTTKGGILLPESAKEKPRQGKVIAIGPGKTDDKGKLKPLDLKAGDHVLFSTYSGTEYKDNYLILNEEDVLAVLN